MITLLKWSILSIFPLHIHIFILKFHFLCYLFIGFFNAITLQNLFFFHEINLRNIFWSEVQILMNFPYTKDWILLSASAVNNLLDELLSFRTRVLYLPLCQWWARERQTQWDKGWSVQLYKTSSSLEELGHF